MCVLMQVHVLVGVNVSVIMCILVWIRTCMCSSAHSCGCVADGGDAYGGFFIIILTILFHAKNITTFTLHPTLQQLQKLMKHSTASLYVDINYFQSSIFITDTFISAEA